ncbi:MAG: hypothetical protein QW594_01755 [Candidatus Woesearchaeota archaeon]
MKNKHVGYLILGFALVLGIITWLFNHALMGIVTSSCSHGPTCPMWGSLRLQTTISFVLIGAIVLFALYFIFFSKDQDFSQQPASLSEFSKVSEDLPKKPNKETFAQQLAALSPDEQYVMNKLLDANGSLFQSDLVQGQYTKVKVTRILDRLEGKGLIERKRRGMTNIILLKHHP